MVRLLPAYRLELRRSFQHDGVALHATATGTGARVHWDLANVDKYPPIHFLLHSVEREPEVLRVIARASAVVMVVVGA